MLVYMLQFLRFLEVKKGKGKRDEQRTQQKKVDLLYEAGDLRSLSSEVKQKNKVSNILLI